MEQEEDRLYLTFSAEEIGNIAVIDYQGNRAAGCHPRNPPLYRRVTMPLRTRMSGFSRHGCAAHRQGHPHYV